MIASEAVPFAKTGGLADVAGALPLALDRLGHRVTLVLPRYRGVTQGQGPIGRIALALGGFSYEAVVYEERLARRSRALLLDCPELYDREGLYNVGGLDYPDNPHRFGFLARAALEIAARSGERPSLVHAHDWQSGLAPVYLKTRYVGNPVIGGVPCVFTIHNLAYQGLCHPAWLPGLDLTWDLFDREALEYWGQVSFLKGGINFSDTITTVSRRYAWEILTPDYGFGFHGILLRRKCDLYGIRNGIDTAQWNPEADAHLPEPFGLKSLEGKRAAKQETLSAFGLPDDDEALERPLIGMVSRMIDQKGFDLLAQIADELPRTGARFAVLGSGEERYQDLWRGLAERYPDAVGARIGFDERLAHLIEGGADMFLMPSRYEPCGLNQMYSHRYGTVPIVRATGGLDDTVTDYDPETRQGTGFTFEEYSSRGLLDAIQRALDLFRHKDLWRRLQLAGMRKDYSWDASAREYVKLYRLTLAPPAPGRDGHL